MATAVIQKIVVDKNKTAEQYIQEAEKFFIIPKIVRDKFPDLVKLVFETESMDDDEREYWLQILPIMNEDQIQKLMDILANEKDQLAQLDAQYENEMSRINNKHMAELDEVELKEKLQKVKKEEAVSEEEERKREEEILKELGDL